MLAQLRDASKGWIAGFLIFLLIAAFAIWGVEDVFLTRPSDTVAKVGDQEIKRQEFLNAFDRVTKRFGEQSNRNIQREEALRMGLDRVTLNQLISDSLIDQEAQRMKLAISDKALVGSIREVEAFAGADGKFDPEAYKILLAQNQLTAKRYESDVRSSMIADQLVDSVMSGVDAPIGFAQAFYDYGEQRRKVSYIAVPLSAAGKIGEPSEEDLKSLYADNKERFTAPEFRTFSYFLLSPETLMDRVEVPEEDIVQLYNFHKDKYVTPEKREIRQVLFDNMEQAQAAYNRLKAGEDFIKVANERGFSANDTQLGTIAKTNVVDPSFGEAAFALKAPGITEPVQGQLDIAILKVDSITPGTERKLEEVKGELTAERAKDLATNLVFDISRDIDKARAGGQTLEEIAEAQNLKLFKAEKVNRRGLTEAGTPPEGLGTISLSILQQAFESDIGDDNDFAETTSGSGSYFVTQVEDVIPSALKPFEDVQADVVTLWQQIQQREKLLEHGAGLAERARSGETLEALAATYGGRVITPVDPIGRTATDENRTPNLVVEAFRTPVGGMIDGFGQGERVYVVAQINDVVEAPQDQKLFMVANMENSLERALQQDITEHYIMKLEDRQGVTRDSKALAAALGQTATSTQ